MYIYKISNIVNNKVYIGQTVAKYPSARWSHHKYQLRNGKHGNSHLQRSWCKYGESAFVFSIICECSSLDELNASEVEYMNQNNAFNSEFGYNIREGGSRKRHSEETKRKMSASSIGKNKGKIPWIAGKRHTDVAKQKMSVRMSGSNHPNFGKHLPEQQRKKIGDSHRGLTLIGKPHPAFINIITGEIIPSGSNLHITSKKLSLDSSSMTKIIKGVRKQHKGWILLKDGK